MPTPATMAPVGPQRKRTYRAEAAGTYTRGFGVMQGADDDECKAPTGAAVDVLGIIAETVAAAIHDPISVVVGGECIAIAGGIVTPNMRVKVEAEGDFIDGSGADVPTVGIVRSSAIDGQEFVLEVMPIHQRS